MSPHKSNKNKIERRQKSSLIQTNKKTIIWKIAGESIPVPISSFLSRQHYVQNYWGRKWL